MCGFRCWLGVCTVFGPGPVSCVHLSPSPPPSWMWSDGGGPVGCGVSAARSSILRSAAHPFSASKPPAIVCRAWNEPTQRSIKPGGRQPGSRQPGSRQPDMPLTPNCPLSLVCPSVCVWWGCVRRWSDWLHHSNLTSSILSAECLLHDVMSSSTWSNLKVCFTLQHSTLLKTNLSETLDVREQTSHWYSGTLVTDKNVDVKFF